MFKTNKINTMENNNEFNKFQVIELFPEEKTVANALGISSFRHEVLHRHALNVLKNIIEVYTSRIAAGEAMMQFGIAQEFPSISIPNDDNNVCAILEKITIIAKNANETAYLTYVYGQILLKVKKALLLSAMRLVKKVNAFNQSSDLLIELIENL